jgi:hypothetical protein
MFAGLQSYLGLVLEFVMALTIEFVLWCWKLSSQEFAIERILKGLPLLMMQKLVSNSLQL